MDICRIGLIGAGNAVRGIGNDVRAPYAEALRTHRLACALARSAATGPARTAGGPEPDRPGACAAASPLESR